MASNKFRDRVSDNPNRRKLTIISQSPNTIIADIERADTVTGDAGTPISAAVLNNWDDTVNAANTKSDSALATANSAKSDATAAVNTANASNATSAEAKSIAESANQKAIDAETKANAAVSTANSAETKANSAVTTANSAANVSASAETKANTAVTTSNSAESKAGEAVTTANMALSTANSAKSEADSAVRTSNASNSTSVEAKSTADSANQTATAARNYVNALTQAPDCSQAGNIGTPSVTFADAGNGLKKFVFSNLKGDKGNTGDAAGFGQITATATALPIGGNPYANISSEGANTAKNITFDFGLPAGIQGERGEKGDSTFVRYSFDKTTMTEQPTDNTLYIGFYTGTAASVNPSEYKWSRFGGAESLSASEYAALLSANQVNPEQIYFVQGVGDSELVITQEAINSRYNPSNSGLHAENVQEAIDEIILRFSSASNIATILGLTSDQLTQLTELAKAVTVTGEAAKDISFTANSVNIQ